MSLALDTYLSSTLRWCHIVDADTSGMIEVPDAAHYAVDPTACNHAHILPPDRSLMDKEAPEVDVRPIRSNLSADISRRLLEAMKRWAKNDSVRERNQIHAHSKRRLRDWEAIRRKVQL